MYPRFNQKGLQNCLRSYRVNSQVRPVKFVNLHILPIFLNIVCLNLSGDGTLVPKLGNC